MSALILKTKLELPQVGKTLIRDRLIIKFKENLDKKLILIYADAGYGKTTLIRHIATDLIEKFIYFDPEPVDQDIGTLIIYIATAIKSHYPAFNLTQTQIIANSANLDALMGLFINECVSNIKDKLYIIIDNFHNIEQNTNAVKAINYLVRHLPANLHVVIASRSKPDFDLTYYSAKQEMYYLDRQDLVFTHAEISDMINKIYGFDIAVPDIERIEQYSKGWITAIQLILQRLRKTNKDEIAKVLNNYLTSDEEVFNYFANEIIEKQSPVLKEFMLKTSLLDYFDIAICKKVLKFKNAESLIRQIVTENMFINPLDHQFTFHPLFQRTLYRHARQQYGDHVINSLHVEIARHYEKKNIKEWAIEHLIKASEHIKAAVMIEKNAFDLINQGQYNQLNELINRLPMMFVESRPWLLVHKAKIDNYRGRWKDSINNLKNAESLFRKKRDRKGCAEAAFENGVALLRQGHTDDAEKYFKRSLRCRKNHRNVLGARTYHLLGSIKTNAGAYRWADHFLKNALKIAHSLKNPSLQAQIINAMAVLEYRRHNYIREMELYQLLIDKYSQEIISPIVLANLLNNTAVYCVEQGQYDKANEMMQKAESLANKYNNKRILLYLNGVRGKYHYMRKEYARAIEFFKNAAAMNTEFGERQIDIYVNIDLALVYLDLNDLDLADQHLEKVKSLVPARLITRHLQYLQLQARSYYLRSDLKMASKLYQRVYREAKRSNDYRILFNAALFLFDNGFKRRRYQTAVKFLSEVFDIYQKYRIDRHFTDSLTEYAASILSILRSPIIRKRFPRIYHKARSCGFSPISEIIDSLVSKKTEMFEINVNLFGHMRVFKPPMAKEEMRIKWLTKKTKSLFAYLLVNRSSRKHRDTIIEQFWPRETARSGRHNLQMAVSFIRKIIKTVMPGRVKKFDPVLYSDEYYCLNPAVEYKADIDEFDRLSKELLNNSDLSLTERDINRAQAVYADDMCLDLYEPWAEEKRTELRDRFAQALGAAADRYCEARKFSMGLELYQKALKHNPYNESYYRGILNCCASLNDHQGMIEHYKTMERSFMAGLGIKPSKETQELFKKLLPPVR